MSTEPVYSAAVCVECRRAALVPDDDWESHYCSTCGGGTLQVPGAKFGHAELPVFTVLEHIVQTAELSRSEATLIAGELESVGRRWEPPDMVLRVISTRLQGLKAMYDARQEYSRLLLLVAMLLPIVCARMLGNAPARTRSERQSGIRRVVPSQTEQSTLRRLKNG